MKHWFCVIKFTKRNENSLQNNLAVKKCDLKSLGEKSEEGGQENVMV